MDHSEAVRKTIAYASFFDFPLFPAEIHHWLITPNLVSISKLKPYLTSLSHSDQEKRDKLDFFTSSKIQQAQVLAKFLQKIPFLLFVGITGSVAARNAKAEDDIDLMIITSPHTLWLVRPLVLLITGLFFHLRRPYDTPSKIINSFCLNLWLDTLSLTVPSSQRSLYVAHEILQIQPILDKKNTYQRFLLANSWSSQFLANAYHNLIDHNSLHSTDSSVIHLFLWPFNYLSYLLQLFYMSSKRTSEIVYLHGAFLHTVNFSQKLDNFLQKT